MNNLQSANEQPFLRNAWYVAALSSEVEEKAYFTRKILSESILIYRSGSGKPVALHDRCPHRFAPLSLGSRNGDNVTCLYHGLQFDTEGECVKNPHGNGKIPKACKVQRYITEERDGFIWIWMGDPEQADKDKILDCSILSENPASSVGHMYMHNRCNYELLTDNIMDLSHIDHLHGPFINTGGKLSPLIPEITENRDGKPLHVRWDWVADPVIPLIAPHMQRPDDKADMFLAVTWTEPSNLTLTLGTVQDSSDYLNDGIMLFDFHIMTPETETSTHYYFASTRNYKMDDAEYNAAKMAGMREAFTTEDKPVIEAQQQEMGTHDLWSLNPVLLSCDAGAVRARRKLSALIEAENI